MNWDKVKYFNKREFNKEVGFIDEFVIYKLDKYRSILQERIYPSPANGSIARFGPEAGSQHWVGGSPKDIIRNSTAIDIFVEGVPFLNFMVLKEAKLFSGIGIYLDTRGPDGKPWVMFHLDTRTQYTNTDPLMWIATKKYNPTLKKITTMYDYPLNNSDCWKLLTKKLFFTAKELA